MTTPQPSRRRMLVAGATLLLAGPAVLSGCAGSPPAPQDPDPLEAPARRAEADSTLAQAVAQLAGPAQPELATAASALAADRAAHASALHAELRRVRPAPASSTVTPPAASPSAPADPDLTRAHARLTEAVRAAQDEAAALVLTLPGYRAALLASISACCATHAAVLP